MKASALFLFLGLSILAHLLVAGGLYFYAQFQEPRMSSDVLDLTVMPYGGSVSSAPRSASGKTAQSVKAVEPGTSADSQAPVPVAGSETASPGSGEDSSGGMGGGGLGEWSELTQKPKVTKEVKARYTDEARTKGLEGLVICDLVIGENGHIRSVTLVQGLDAGLDRAALEALKSFEFSPAKIGDRAVAVKIRYKYRFQLQHQ
ncbi:Gram-negative bacterial tonB protein [compost metagenome]